MVWEGGLEWVETDDIVGVICGEKRVIILQKVGHIVGSGSIGGELAAFVIVVAEQKRNADEFLLGNKIIRKVFQEFPIDARRPVEEWNRRSGTTWEGEGHILRLEGCGVEVTQAGELVHRCGAAGRVGEAVELVF